MRLSAMQREIMQEAGREPGRETGFTLMETIVALALFSGVYVLLNQGLTAGWQGQRRADMDAGAVALATAQLASAGVETPLADGLRTSGQQGVFSWDTSVEKYIEPGEDLLSRDASRNATGAAFSAYWVAVDVSWPSGPLQKPRSLRLRTLKLGRS
jgi:prepilin-type N-terminal cleavage/methylation domain-containing protein